MTSLRRPKAALPDRINSEIVSTLNVLGQEYELTQNEQGPCFYYRTNGLNVSYLAYSSDTSVDHNVTVEGRRRFGVRGIRTPSTPFVDLILVDLNSPIWDAAAKKIADQYNINFQYPAGDGIGHFEYSRNLGKLYEANYVSEGIEGVFKSQEQFARAIQKEVERIVLLGQTKNI